jgi:hypothetical protein
MLTLFALDLQDNLFVGAGILFLIVEIVSKLGQCSSNFVLSG